MPKQNELTVISVKFEDYVSSHANKQLMESVPFIQSENRLQSGSEKSSFLITVWTNEEVEGLLKRGSEFLFFQNEKKELIGYIVLSPVTEFLLQLDGNENTFKRDLNGQEQEWIYLYQIALHGRFQGIGVGKAMLNSVLAQRKLNFVSDYMVHPKVNIASQRLFEALGFIHSGTLTLESYRGFDPSKWQIVTFG